MTTLLFSHPSSEEHDNGPGHPESPDRIRAVNRILGGPGFGALVRREAPRADLDNILRIHREDYVNALLEMVPAEGYAEVDPDTRLSPGSGEAALYAVGAMVAAVDAVLAGEAKTAFCAVRPPGHHAEPGRGMGFCLFNNIAICAAHARGNRGLERVAIVDFDVHHGNGTQAAFQSDPTVLFASSHQYPFYPGTGAAEERGVGNIFNVPLAPGAGSEEFRAGMEQTVLPALENFNPELILISAGFDAHAADPLAAIELTEDDFAWITARLIEVAGEYCDGRIVSTLEGGYDLNSLADSVAAHVGELMRN
ncbi:MAG: histone deacetylase family protein [Alphaproteobacteria bacterium]